MVDGGSGHLIRTIASRLGSSALAGIASAAPFAFLFLFAPACDSPAPSNRAPILLFAGKGTSAGDVAAVERILDDNHLEYATATSRQLNRMTTSQLMTYRLVIVPGGNFMD